MGSAPSRGRGSKPPPDIDDAAVDGRLLQGGVDRNYKHQLEEINEISRLRHGGVDRNFYFQRALPVFLRGRLRRQSQDVVGGVLERDELATVGQGDRASNR